MSRCGLFFMTLLSKKYFKEVNDLFILLQIPFQGLQ